MAWEGAMQHQSPKSDSSDQPLRGEKGKRDLQWHKQQKCSRNLSEPLTPVSTIDRRTTPYPESDRAPLKSAHARDSRKDRTGAGAALECKNFRSSRKRPSAWTHEKACQQQRQPLRPARQVCKGGKGAKGRCGRSRLEPSTDLTCWFRSDDGWAGG